MSNSRKNRNGAEGMGAYFVRWLRSQFRKQPKPLWIVITADVLLLGVSLVVFALFHHVLPRRGASSGIVSNRTAAGGGAGLIAVNDADEEYADDGEVVDMDLSAMTANEVTFNDDAGEADAEGDLEAAEDGEATAYADAGGTADAGAAAASPGDVEAADAAQSDPADDPAQVSAAQAAGAASGLETEYTVEDFKDTTAAPPGNFADKFADKFTSGPVVKTDSGYQSANVNVTLTQYDSKNATFYVADIYVKDISCLVTAFARDSYGKGIREAAKAISKRIGALISINGDYYGARDDGIVIRNGELFRSDKYPVRDVAVLFWDGTLETYSAKVFDAEAAMNAGAYQAWNFGPRLLDEEGKAKTTFNSDVGPANPRTAIGYFEPGHYCFVTVDGRTKNSKGLTLKELAKLMEQLGCARAFNLDGGNTSVMVAGSTVVNHPSGGGRPTSDIISIVDF